MTDHALQPNDAARQRRFTIGACVLLAIAGFYLWTEHRAHLLGALPYVLLLACPAMHLFMHHGHRGHSSRVGDHPHHSEESTREGLS